MGLMVHSLDNIPTSARRKYFIYLLDYGWIEPISEALMKNFDRMASKAAENNAVIIKGTEGSHFEDEVFSWHQINGIDGKEILPALLITNMHPSYFRDKIHHHRWGKTLLNESDNGDMKLIIIPFRKFCKSTTDVIELIHDIFKDIESNKDIMSFSISRKIQRAPRDLIFESLILEPSIAGFGVNLKAIISKFINK